MAQKQSWETEKQAIIEQRVLHSGKPDLIARHLDKETILENFGEDSAEYLAFEHHQAELLIGSAAYPSANLQVPGMTEDPRVNYQMLQTWLRDFYRSNRIPLPEDFSRRNKASLTSLFNMTLDKYRIPLEQILPPKEDF